MAATSLLETLVGRWVLVEYTVGKEETGVGKNHSSKGGR